MRVICLVDLLVFNAIHNANSDLPLLYFDVRYHKGSISRAGLANGWHLQNPDNLTNHRQSADSPCYAFGTTNAQIER